ncbi:hypothetical protein V498_08320, partial [Pseudogymnoascus sp. VKM F-4517 (FW-2822)]
MEGLIEPTTEDGSIGEVGPGFAHLFSSLDREYHGNILSLLLQDAIGKHITCSRDARIRVNVPQFLSINYASFHLTFFELIKSATTGTASSWKSGKLYGGNTDYRKFEKSTDMCIREGACTILVIIDDAGQYWTALYMRPETFHRYIRSERCKDNKEGIAADLLIQAIECVIAKWIMISKHLKTFIVDHHLLFDPEGHDRLLFD